MHRLIFSLARTWRYPAPHVCQSQFRMQLPEVMAHPATRQNLLTAAFGPIDGLLPILVITAIGIPADTTCS